MEINWPILKQFSIDRKVPIQYVDLISKYWLKCFDNQFAVECFIDKNNPAGTFQKDFEDNFKSSSNISPIQRSKQAVSDVPVSLRIEGIRFAVIKLTTHTEWWALPGDRRLRGAKFQFNFGQAGDSIKVWVTDKDGLLGYGPNFRLTNYIPHYCVMQSHSDGTGIVDEVIDTDTSDVISAGMYLEIEYASSGVLNNVDAIINFWTYIEGQT